MLASGGCEVGAAASSVSTARNGRERDGDMDDLGDGMLWRRRHQLRTRRWARKRGGPGSSPVAPAERSLMLLCCCALMRTGSGPPGLDLDADPDPDLERGVDAAERSGSI